MEKLPLVLLVLSIISCSPTTPEQLLQQAQELLVQADYISYQQTSFWPDPTGVPDTSRSTAQFTKHANTYFEYDFILDRPDQTTEVYLDEQFIEISHANREVLLYSSKDLAKLGHKYFPSFPLIKWSPVTFLRQDRDNWIYQNDTIINDQALVEYLQVVRDTFVKGKSSRITSHIFLDPATKWLTRFERQNYYGGELLQKVVLQYADFSFESNDDQALVLTLPKNYVSVNYSERKTFTPLKVGAIAPTINVQDITGKTWSFEQYPDKYFLLYFSIINCGYCQQALEFFNQEAFQLSDKIVPLYINIEDSETKINQFKARVNIPFPIITAADSLRQAYGVRGYPAFFLINPDGKIERFIRGFTPEEIKKLASL